MLALAALYRHGLGFQAEKLKLSAIRALSASIVGGFGVHSAVQHVAAGMILCLFEVCPTFCYYECEIMGLVDTCV